MPAPHLTFFCELEPEPLVSLIGRDLVQDLQELNASLSLGILDFSPARAQVVNSLNQAGIPVIAWLLLPREQGYWFNLENVDQAYARYQEFLAWTESNGLVWDGVGLDVEPDIRELEQLSLKGRLKLAGKVAIRVVRHRKYTAAARKYLELIDAIHADGWRVDSYQLPIIADDRKAHATLLQRMAGVIDLPVDREVWMLYSSFLGASGSGLLGSYGPEAQSIGLGSTGGGVNVGIGDARSLSWEELSRDMRLAWHWNEDIHIFSLEGCARQNFIPRLKAFVWDKPILLPDVSTDRVNAWRGLLQTVLWLSAHLSSVIFSLVAVWWAVLRLRSILQRRED